MIESVHTQAAPAREHLPRARELAGRLGRNAARPIALTLCIFLASHVRWLQIPSPFAAVLLLSETGASSPFTLIGLAASLALRLMWGVDVDAWQYVGCAALWLIKLKCKPRQGLETAALAGLAMMPRAVAALMGSGSPMSMLLACAAVPVGMLCAAYIHGALAALENGLPTGGARERVSASLICLVVISGLGYFRLLGVNLGQAAAAAATLAAAYACGSACGATCGLVCGLALALTGHDVSMAFGLSLCGLFCGLLPKRRWLVALAACAANLLAFALTIDTSPPLGFASLGVGGLLLLCMRDGAMDRVKALVSIRSRRGMENRFIRQRIEHLQSAVTNVARALPLCEDSAPSSGMELGALLCAQCVNREECWGGGRARTEKMLTAMMELSRSGISSSGLTLLEEHGCLRAGAIDDIARDALMRRQLRLSAQKKARFEREMALTHLSAMSGTLRELEILSAGDSMADLHASHIIRQAMEELRIPAKLDYARRLDGHLQVSLHAESMLPMQKYLESLLRTLEENEGMSLSIARAAKGVVELEEIPLYSAAVGTAQLCAAAQSHAEPDASAVSLFGTEDACGDTCQVQRCDGGRLLMMLSDGMGHGQLAKEQSQKTLELLELMLEAGYSRAQAITAVNGVMLGAQGEDSFSTVDICDVDLWTGDVYSEKLGACPSWVVRGNHFKKLEGSSLPLGIMEQAVPTAVQYRLHSGDILIMMSDGVTDLFAEDEQIKHLLSESLFIQPQRMADAILRNALLLSEGKPKDDMSVMVMLLMDRKRGVM